MSDTWLLETIKAKSDQLNACDLVGGPITVTIQGVKKLSSADQPVSIEIGEGRQPYKPCKSMRRVLVACWGTEKWVGRSMTLCCDPGVMFGGQRVGGIRISHVSHIDGPKEIPLTITRGKSAVYVVQPLKVDAKPQESVQDRINKVLAAIGAAKSQEALDKIMRLAGPLYDSLDQSGQAQIDSAKAEKVF